VASPGAWELAVPNGTYSVTVAVGDAAANYDSVHRINVEGQLLINNFVPTSANRFATATTTVTVGDGKLTVDPTGGKNTKIDYLTIAAGSASIVDTWTSVTWRTIAAAPLGLSEAGGATVNGKLYVIGGYYNSTYTPTNKVFAYTAASNTWQALAPVPQAVTHMGVATDDQYIYVAGGYPPGATGSGQIFATAAVWRYDTAANTWSAMPTLPQARGGGSLVLLGRTLHYFGGSDLSRADRAEHWTLSLDGGTAWGTAAAMPVARNHLGGVALDGKIYAVGGQQGQDAAAVYSGRLDVWSPTTNAWTSGASLPSPRSHIAAATFVLGGRIIALGGETSYNVSTSQAIAYNPSTNGWSQLSPLPVSRNSGVGGALGGNLCYATGTYFTTTTYKGVPVP
jgi:N-acetylneuraminic acid mutarotase